MRITARKLAANRANALKSTGPRTPEGLRRASRNNTRHGILANAILIEGESRDEFLALLAALDDEYHPETPTEFALVNKAAVAQWRLFRTWTYDASAITHEMHRQAEATPERVANRKKHTRAMLAAQALNHAGNHLDRMSVYEQRYDAQHRNAIRDLDRLRDRKCARGTPHREYDVRTQSSVENTELTPPESQTESHAKAMEPPRNPMEAPEKAIESQSAELPDQPEIGPEIGSANTLETPGTREDSPIS